MWTVKLATNMGTTTALLTSYSENYSTAMVSNF